MASNGPDIVDDSLAFYLDAASGKSYPDYNLISYSQDFTNAYWSNNEVVIQSTNELAPDGTYTATRLADANTAAYRAIYRTITIPADASSYNVSLYIRKTKGATSSTAGVNVTFSGGTGKNYYVRFNTDTGNFKTIGDTALSTNVNSDYWRLSFTVSNNGAANNNTSMTLYFYPAAGPYDHVGGDSITSTGSHTIWGMQVTRGTELLPYRTTLSTRRDTWTDLSSANNNGTVLNGLGFSANNKGCMVFDGVDDYVMMYNATNYNSAVRTVIAWVNSSNYARDTAVFGPSSNGADNWLGFGQITAGDNRAYVATTESADVNNGYLVGTTLLTNNTWYQLACTLNTNLVTLYVNGKEEASYSYSWTVGVWKNQLAVGRRGDVSQRYFLGNMGNVSGYYRVLSANEIKQNFNALRGRYGI